MGTPEFAVPSLDLMARTHEVVDVVTQPDRPKGRGRRLQPPAVKRRALELGLRVHQPERIRGEESLARLTEDRPDVIVVVGYGQMIPKRIREIGAHGCVNVHSSLLPKYRGAAPVNWALVRGETRTGVTTMRLVREMDAGDILMARETEIGPDETASELNRRLAPIGAELLLETLASLERGTVRPKPQDHSAATRAPLIKKQDGPGQLAVVSPIDLQPPPRFRTLAGDLQFLPRETTSHPGGAPGTGWRNRARPYRAFGGRGMRWLRHRPVGAGADPDRGPQARFGAGFRERLAASARRGAQE